MPVRTKTAVAAGSAVAAASRLLGRGDGTVIGGRATLVLDPRALGRLVAGRPVALVTGTNGKTTTNRLLAAAAGRLGQVATNSGGSNLPAGLVAALGAAPLAVAATLEVDEAYLGRVAAETRPAAVILLNLARDQLDRISEVRKLADRWRRALPGLPTSEVIANCDDPLVVWAARAAPRVRWVAAGQPWTADATGCPACGGRVCFSSGWSCTSCGAARPSPDVWLDGGDVVVAGGSRHSFTLGLPGRFNRANAAMAATAAEVMGVPMGQALDAMSTTTEVAGRYQLADVGGVPTRLLLAKNPAGWLGLLELVEAGSAPLVVAINARVADGRDPSWLWDVAFERLADRYVVASGERAADLAVRLHYAGVDHETVPDPLAAVAAAARSVARGRPVGGPGQPDPDPPYRVEFVGNYTAFQDLRAGLRAASR